MAKKITETGPIGLRGIRNTDLYNNLGSLAQSGDEDAATLLSALSSGKNRPFSAGDDVESYFTPQQYPESTPYSTLGESQYDEPYILGSDQNDVGEIRYENQPWYDTLANGVGKMLGTAATTFVSSLVGLPYGLSQAALQGRASAIWDNSVTEALANVDSWLDENMVNYKSQKQQNSPWYDPSNLFSMNFIADDIIKNAGFTLGAAASMAVGSGALGLMSRAMGFVNDVGKGTKMANAALSALFSATGEGMIEARQGVEERNKLEMQRLNDALAPEREQLNLELEQANQEYAENRGFQTVRGADGRLYDAAYMNYRDKIADINARKAALDQKLLAGQQQIQDSGQDMGNMILGANQVLLTTGNLIQFSKGMVKSFDKARHAAETSSKSVKPSWVSAKRVSDNLADGYKIKGRKLGTARALTKGLLTEGSEEMNQQWIQNTAGYATKMEDVNDYWKARLDPESMEDAVNGTYTLGQAINRGFSESWGDVDQWEQFLIGGLTGMAGSYSPTKLFNQDKSKSRWNPARYGSWEGGAYNELRDFNREYRQYEENINAVNDVLASEDFPSRVSSLIGHTFLEKQKAQAADNGDMKAWKDADDKQAIHDIQAFLRAGKMDDLRAIYNSMSADMSNEDIENIVKSTTREISKDEDKKNHDDALDEQIAERQRHIDALNTQLSALQTSVVTPAPETAPSEAASPETTVPETAGEQVASSSPQPTIQPQLLQLQEDIRKENEAIQRLRQEKDDYKGQKRFEGAFVDNAGNTINTNDEIREQIKHNSEELNRKLDSYLDSIDTVNRMTNGQLSKEQEDNLAYLHNMSKEKSVRFDKIMSNVRKQLPSKFLLKTDKTPEQLTKENASSDLSFAINDNTPDGYVEVDTSLMNDANFGNFFAENVLWGQNIQPTMTADEIAEELKAIKEDKQYSKDEQEKRRKERQKKHAETAQQRSKQSEEDRQAQQEANLHLIRKALVDNALQRQGKTLQEALNSDDYGKLLTDINDALTLKNEAAEYYNTFNEYMSNPQKVEQKKAKEEKNNEDKRNSKVLDGMSLSDFMDRPDADNIRTMRESKEGKNSRGAAAKTAVGLNNTIHETESRLDEAAARGVIDKNAAEDAKKLLQVQMDKYVSSYNDNNDAPSSIPNAVNGIFDYDTETMLDSASLLDDSTLAQLESGAIDVDSLNLDERLEKAKDALATVEDPVRKKLKELEERIDMDKLLSSIDDYERRENQPSEKAAADLSSSLVDADQPKSQPRAKRNDEPTPMRSVVSTPSPAAPPAASSASPSPAASTPSSLPSLTEAEEQRALSSGSDTALSNDMEDGTNGENIPQDENDSSWHPWMSSTSEVGLRSNDPYVPSPRDPHGAFKKKRYDVIRKKLEDLGAYNARKEGKVKEGMPVGFKVFQDVNEAAEDFVIFITDESGNNVIGDMPSNDPRLATSRRDISMDDFYAKVMEEWNNASEEERAKGMQSKYKSEVDYLLIGKVRYQQDRQTVKQLMDGSSVSPMFAIKTPVGMHTGRRRKNKGDKNSELIPLVTGVNPPRTGSPGQPYILIPTSKVHDETEPRFRYYAVPIKTITVGEAIESNAIIVKVLKTLLDKLKAGSISDFQAARLLRSLLAVANVHVNLEADSNTKKGLGIRVTSYARKEGTEKHNSFTIFEGKREDMDIDQIMQNLSRFSINVSASFINGNENGYEYPFEVNGQKVDYNAMIAEVANTNAAEPRTVNDWFTIRPLIKDGDGLKKVETRDKKTEWKDIEPGSHYEMKANVGGKQRTWTVELVGWKVIDENGNEIKKGDKDHTDAEWKEARRLAAEAQGLYYLRDRETPFAIMFDENAYIYIPSTGEFKTYEALEKDPRYNYKELKGGNPLSATGRYYLMQSFLDTVGRDTSPQEIMNGEAEAAPINASEGKPSGTAAKKPAKPEDEKQQVDHTKEVESKLKEMEDNSKKFKLVRWDEKEGKYVEDTRNGEYYQDEKGTLHARVSNVNDADVEVLEAEKAAGWGNIPPQLKTASTGAGNSVDRFVRDIFAGGDPLYGIDLSKQDEREASIELAKALYENVGNPNITEEDAVNLILSLHQALYDINRKEETGEWEVNSTGIVAEGMVSFDGDTIVHVAGTIDLLLYNKKKGQYVIVDMKTHLRDIYDIGHNLKTDEKTLATIAHWRAQQTLYKQFLEKKYGITISGIRIMPFSVSYSTYFSNTDYAIDDNGVLTDKGIPVNIHPVYDGRLIQLTPKENVIYDMGHLPESVKSLLPKLPTVERRPDERPLPIKQKLQDLYDKVPNGMYLADFVREEYADDETIKKLAGIFDENNGSDEPVLMTEASQNALLDALDTDAIEKAHQESLTAAEDLPLDIPQQDERPLDERFAATLCVSIEDLDADVLSELPDSIKESVVQHPELGAAVGNMIMDNEDIENIISYVHENAPVIRHKKASKIPYRVLDLQKELRWLQRALPQLSSSRRLQIVKGLIQCSDGSADYGRLQGDIILIGNQAEEGTVYHEAFHAVVQFLLTDDEIDSLHKAAVRKWGNLNPVTLEEKLADEFEYYMKGLDYEAGPIKKFFRELWTAIKALFSNKYYMDNLFRSINRGVYAGREFRDDRNNVFRSITSEQREHSRDYAFLTADEKERLHDDNISSSVYNQLNKKEKEYMLHCVV